MLDKKTTLHDLYATYYTVYRDELEYNMIFKYCGVLESEIIRGLATRLEEDILKYGDKKAVVKRLFSILIEGVQNVLLHGDLTLEGKPEAFLMIAKNPMHYKLIMGNFIKQDRKNYLINYLGNINSHDEVEIKKLYMQYLREGLLMRDSHSGLGLIAMRMKSNKPIDYSFYKLNDLPFLVLEIEVNRNK